MKQMMLIGLVLLLSILSLNAQIVDPKKESKKQGVSRTNKNIKKGIDKGFDKLEKGIGGLFSKKKKKSRKNTDSQEVSSVKANENSNASSNDNEASAKASPQNKLTWSKFDFVPGDEVIFEDGPDISEENGEFPSRWDLSKGQVEIAMVDGQNVIMFIDGSPAIIPFLENSKEDYLPEIFTVEFDFYRPAYGNRFSFYLADVKNQKQNQGQLFEISYDGVSSKADGIRSEHPERDRSWNKKGFWTHVSLAYTKGKLKMYLDDTRVLNIPRYPKNPSGVSFQAYWADLGEDKPFYLKNIRIAKGGVKYYDRVVTDGKIVCNGIRFESAKSVLKPESMGPINKIYALMLKQANLNFSVEGHTDSDGELALNQKLSEERALAVKDKLISMGIASNRFKTQGFGESVPIDNNASPEGKANNRRVEFVKF